MASDPSLTYSVLPTGGLISLGLTSAANDTWTLTRAVSGASGLSTPVTIYDGPCLAGISNDPPMEMTFIDANDGSPLPLDQNTAYVYTFTTSNGFATTPPITPSVSIEIEPDPLVDLIIKMLTAGVQALRIPAGFPNKPTFLHSMPVNSQPSLPLIAINQDLMQQEHVGIGDGIDPDMKLNRYTVSAIVSRRLNVTVATTTVEERKFYRDAILTIWRAMLGPFLGVIGQDINQRFQAADNQNVEPNSQPGWYYSEIMLDFSGTFNVGVTTNYGQVAAIAYEAYPTPTYNPINLPPVSALGLFVLNQSTLG